LDGIARTGKIPGTELETPKAELQEDLCDTLGVFGISGHPDIQITGKARIAMQCNGMATDNEKPNPV